MPPFRRRATTRRDASWRQAPSPSDDALGGVARPARRGRARRRPAGATSRARTPATMSGSVESGRPDADAHAVEVGAAELAPQRLQAVVAGEAAAEPHADVAERQVDLVVDDEDAIEVEAVGAARRADGAAGLVHVGLRLEQGDPRAARAGAALGQLAGELLARLRQVPALAQRVRDLEADVVGRAVVAAPGIAETDDEPVDRCGGEELQLSSADCAASPPVSPSASAAASAPSSAPSPTRPVSVSISSSTGSRVGGVTVATTVSGSSRNVDAARRRRRTRASRSR